MSARPGPPAGSAAAFFANAASDLHNSLPALDLVSQLESWIAFGQGLSTWSKKQGGGEGDRYRRRVAGLSDELARMRDACLTGEESERLQMELDREWYGDDPLAEKEDPPWDVASEMAVIRQATERLESALATLGKRPSARSSAGGRPDDRVRIRFCGTIISALRRSGVPKEKERALVAEVCMQAGFGFPANSALLMTSARAWASRHP